MAVQAIETTYAGHRFRSRLEARWAVFFDRLGVAWNYEPQGFKIQGASGTWNWLPDFYLPELEVWVEVKGDAEALDWTMIATAVDGWATAGLPPSRYAYTGDCTNMSTDPCNCGRCGSMVLVLGNIPKLDPYAARPAHYAAVNHKAAWITGAWFNDAGNLKLTNQDIGCFDATSGDTEVQWWGNTRPKQIDYSSVAGASGSFSKVMAAYDAARKARFEHGRAG